MSTMKQSLGLMVGGALVAMSVWACTATRTSDGGIRIELAPDMVIRARGLEGALEQLTELLGACRSGTYSRPCTDKERSDIRGAIRDVLQAKNDFGDRVPGSLPLFRGR